MERPRLWWRSVSWEGAVDLAGHDKIHGSRHPEDLRLPFVIHSDRMAFEGTRKSRYNVTDLKDILEKILPQN